MTASETNTQTKTNKMSSPTAPGPAMPPSGSSDENLVASCLTLLNEIDEWISHPIFRLGLPKWLEFWYSIPACFFGTSFSQAAGPLWVALLALMWGEQETCGTTLVDNTFLLKCITFFVTAIYVVAWGFWQIGGYQSLATSIFWNIDCYVLAIPFNVAVLAYIVLGLPNGSDLGNETDCNYANKKAIFSMAIYPMFLWPFLITLLN